MAKTNKPWNKMDKRLRDEVNLAISNAGATQEFAEWILRRDHAVRLVRWMMMEVAGEADPVYADMASEWMHFYQEVFGLTTDFAEVRIPDEQPGFGWVVMIAKDLTLQQTWAKCEARFPSCLGLIHGLAKDAVFDIEDRPLFSSYAVRFRNRVGADVENKDISAHEFKRKGLKGITLLERLVLELWYHWKTSDHLDERCVTLCAGSRLVGGDVPSVNWRGKELFVGSCRAIESEEHVSIRSAFDHPECPSVDLVCSAPDVLAGPVNRR